MADLGGVVFNDYSAEVLEAMHDAVVQALERCGEQAEGYAKDLTPVDTGNLRNSITHQVDDGEAPFTSEPMWSMRPMWNWAQADIQKEDGPRHGPTRTTKATGTGRREIQHSLFSNQRWPTMRKLTGTS